MGIFIKSAIIALIIVIIFSISRKLIYLSIAYLQYKRLCEISENIVKENIDKGYVKYGSLPGMKLVNRDFETFKSLFNKNMILINNIDNFTNFSTNTAISSDFICINNEVIVPPSFSDYRDIICYITNNSDIRDVEDPRLKMDALKILNDVCTSSYYKFKSLDDIITLKMYPHHLIKDKIFYYRNNKVYTTSVIMIFEILIILSFFKIYKNDIEQNKEINKSEAIKNVCIDIKSYIDQSLLTESLYVLSCDETTIENTISLLLDKNNTGIISDVEELNQFIDSSTGRNYTASNYKYIPDDIKLLIENDDFLN